MYSFSDQFLFLNSSRSHCDSVCVGDVVGDTAVPAGHGGDNNHRTDVPQVRQREGGQLAALQSTFVSSKVMKCQGKRFFFK